jgi:hypothetical protein
MTGPFLEVLRCFWTRPGGHLDRGGPVRGQVPGVGGDDGQAVLAVQTVPVAIAGRVPADLKGMGRASREGDRADRGRSNQFARSADVVWAVRIRTALINVVRPGGSHRGSREPRSPKRQR